MNYTDNFMLIGPNEQEVATTLDSWVTHMLVVDGPGDACILMLILLSQEGLSGMRNESHTQVTSCEPSFNE